jgi:hypothetical protein
MDEELLAQLAATPRAAAHLTAEATDAGLDLPGPDGWSARTILAHLRDDEYFNLRVNVERMLAEDNPALSIIDADVWESRRSRHRDRKEHLLADFALQRQASLGMLRLVRSEDAGRAGQHERLGTVTIEQFVVRWVQHDREHIAQLERAIGETVDEVFARRARHAE